MNVYLPNLRLPSEYQEVEWIGRNGNNYIDTLWIPIMSNSWEVQIGYKVSSGSNRYAVLGNYNAQAGNISLEITAQNQGRFYMDTGGGSTGFATTNTISTSSFNEMVFKNNLNSSGTVILNGTSTSGTIYTGGYYNASAYIFIDRKLRWTTFTQDSYVSYCKIYEAGTLVRDFVPCYRKSDGVIGLYDLVNNQFYTNQGTGTFSKGNDVTMAVLKNAYIGKVIEKYIDVRGKTLAQIQAEGWSLNNWRGSYTLNSDGLTVSSSNSSCALYFTLPNTLTTNNKITVKATGYCTVPNSGSYGGLLFAGIGSIAGDLYYNNCIASEYSSGDNTYSGKTGITCNGSMVSSDGPRRVAGNISYELTVDLSTGACNMNLSGPTTYTGTATLTSAQISSILAYNKASAIIEEFTNGYTMRLQTISFTIE